MPFKVLYKWLIRCSNAQKITGFKKQNKTANSSKDREMIKGNASSKIEKKDIK